MQRLRNLFIALLLFGPLSGAVWAHDPYETTMRAYLRAQKFEVRITLNARTVEILLDKAGQSLTNATAPESFEAVHDSIMHRASEWFPVRTGGGAIVPDQVYVTRGVEDHIEVVMIYTRPSVGVVAFEGAYLKQLPADEPYGANFSVVDLVNNLVLGQKVLKSADASFEISIPRVVPPSPTPSSDKKP